jgi:putative ABC transport system permease protein
MSRIPGIRGTFRLPWRSARTLDADVDEELRFHLDMRTAELMKRHGLDSAAARAEAMRQFGDIDDARRYVRAMDQRIEAASRRRLLMESVRQDLTRAVRSLRRNPGFTTIVALTVSLGVAGTTTIFSVADALLLRPLPHPTPERLVLAFSTSLSESRGETSLPDFLDLRAGFRHVGELAAYNEAPYTVAGDGPPEHAEGATVTVDFLRVLGTSPVLGRAFVADEERGAAPPVVMLGYDFWRRRYAGDSGVIGRTITINTVPRTVVGIAPPGLVIPANDDVLVPLRTDISRSRRNASLTVVGRLAPGATLEGARRTLASVAARVRAEYPEPDDPTRSVSVVSMRDEVAGAARPAILILLAAVGLLLLVSCANVANLLLVRATTREREMALRAALGASRLRIARQMLIESVVLALTGGALGVALATLAVRVMRLVPLDEAPRLATVTLDGRGLAFALAVSVATGLLFGLAPAMHLASIDLRDRLRGGRGVAGHAVAQQRVRRALVGGEVAIAVVLLVGSGLLLRSIVELVRVRPGFVSEGVFTAQIDLPGRRYPKLEEQPPAFWAALLTALRAAPGVRAAAVASNLPLTGGDRERVTVPGRALAPGGDESARVLVVSDDYFRTMGIALVRGRGFSAEDGMRSPRVAVINAEAARRFWGGRDVIGRRVTSGETLDPGGAMIVVGVVADVVHAGVAAPREPQIYVPLSQHPARGMFVAVRTAGQAEELAAVVRSAVVALDPELPVFDVATMPVRMARDIARPRATAVLVTLFGTAALLLAVVGVYGAVAYAVALRTREMGVRLALGAQPVDLIRLAVRQGMVPVIIGAVLGLLASAGAAQVLRNMLYGVEALDPVTFVVAPLVLAAIALLAAWLPGRRAGRVSPATALQDD